MRLRADKWNSEQSQTDRMLRGLRSQVDDLTETLSAKDGQLAVLKIRLDEADQLLKSRSAALDEEQKEKLRYTLGTTFWSRDQIQLFMNWCPYYFPSCVSRLMQDHTEGSSMQSQALETIQERLQEAETALRREQDSYRQMQVRSCWHSFLCIFLNTWKILDLLILCCLAEWVCWPSVQSGGWEADPRRDVGSIWAARWRRKTQGWWPPTATEKCQSCSWDCQTRVTRLQAQSFTHPTSNLLTFFIPNDRIYFNR